MSKKLEGKIALVTGGSSGLGLATARLFAAEGARVFITGRRQSELDGAVKEIGGEAVGVQGDISNLADLDRLYDVIRRRAGRLDVLFANAGGGGSCRWGRSPRPSTTSTFDINVKGTLFTVQKALPLMPDGASIVLNGSMVSVKGFPGVQRLRRDQGGPPLVCPDVGGGPEAAPDPRERGRPRHRRHAAATRRSWE